jgi:hypothetical protein
MSHFTRMYYIYVAQIVVFDAQLSYFRRYIVF